MSSICDSCYYGGGYTCDATHSFEHYGWICKDVKTCNIYENDEWKKNRLLIAKIQLLLNKYSDKRMTPFRVKLENLYEEHKKLYREYEDAEK